MQKRSGVMILSADTLLRDGLAALITMRTDYQVLVAGATVRELINRSEQPRCEVTLVDCVIPGLSRLSGVLAHLRAASPDGRVVLLVAQQDARLVGSLTQGGCCARVLKEEGWYGLLSALQAAVDGRSYLSPGTLRCVTDADPPEHGSEPALSPLSIREREVMHLVAGGQRTRDIARYLALSPKTVEKHRGTLMRKLGVHNVAGVATYAAMQSAGTARAMLAALPAGAPRAVAMK